MSRIRQIVPSLTAAAAIGSSMLFFAQDTFAQGCALCYNDASATGQQGIAALRHGILLLAIPPMLIFAALFAILFKRRNAHHDAIELVPARNSVRAVSEIVLHLN